MAIREITEGMQRQGEDEEIVYQLTTTQWGSSPSAVSVLVYRKVGSDWEDVTSTVMPTGSPSVAGDVITLPKLKNLDVGETYRVEIEFTSGGNVFEAYAVVKGER